MFIDSHETINDFLRAMVAGTVSDADVLRAASTYRSADVTLSFCPSFLRDADQRAAYERLAGLIDMEWYRSAHAEATHRISAENREINTAFVSCIRSSQD